MKKKHYITTIDDIKYCEEHKRLIFEGVYSDTYKFEDGVWSRYDSDGNLDYYGAGIPTTHNLYYYEEETEKPMQEATENDIHKLCWFWGSNDKNMELGILEGVNCDEDEIKYASDDGFCYHHCRRLSPAEVAEITGYGVTEDGSTFFGEPFKPVLEMKKND